MRSLASLAFATLLSAPVHACMSDAQCNEDSNKITMCCYMNECRPSSSLGCSGDRLAFYKHLQTKDEDCDVEAFAAELREKSDNITKCDAAGSDCLDYVSALMKDVGAFDSLDGTNDFEIISDSR